MQVVRAYLAEGPVWLSSIPEIQQTLDLLHTAYIVCNPCTTVLSLHAKLALDLFASLQDNNQSAVEQYNSTAQPLANAKARQVK